jgi:hypothetical protein
MPIQIDQLETHVDVEAPGGAHDAAPMQAPAEMLPRWQELAQRAAQLAARTAARDFDD